MNTGKSKLTSVLFAGFLFFHLSSGAQVNEKQSDEKPAKIETDISKTYAFDGTYQLEIINTRYMPLLPADLMETIKKNRDQSVIKTVVINQMLRVRILPWNEINSGHFKPFTEKYIHVTE